MKYPSKRSKGGRAVAVASLAMSCGVFPSGVLSASVDSIVAGSWDDAEELASGRVRRASTDLEMTFDAESNQVVGLRFKNIDIPQGAIITNAWIQFTVDESSSTPTMLNIQGLRGYVKTFKTNEGNISSRERTAAMVTWTPPRWRKADGAGPAQKTPDLSVIIQELVDQSSWRAGSSRVGIVITGTGERVAVSYNGNKAKAPRLHIEYDDGAGGGAANIAPIVDAGDAITISFPDNTVLLDGAVHDDGLPSGTLVTTWASDALGVSFSDPSAEDTAVTFSEPGSYQLKLLASDGELTSEDSVTVTVNRMPSAIRSITPVGYFATGQDEDGHWLPVRAIDPAGVYIDPIRNYLMIADSEITEIAAVWDEVHANVFETTIHGDVSLGEYDVSQPIGKQQENLEAAGITKCEVDGYYYIVNDDRQRLYRYAFDGSSMVMVDWVNTFPLNAPAGTLDPEGVTCDASGNIYVVGGHGINILVYHYDGGFVLDRVMDLAAARFASAEEDVPTDPEGIAWDPVSDHLFVMNNDSDEIFEYTSAGEYLGRHSISAVRPRPKQPQGLAIGPSTSGSGKMSFFVADPRVDNNFDETERDGVVYELEIDRNQ